MISRIPGSLMVSASAIIHLSAVPPATLSPSELSALATPLHFEGGPETPDRFSITMQGQYEVTWDLSGFTLPPVNTHQDYQVVPYVYVLSRDNLRPVTYDPVPSNTTQSRVRLYRAYASPYVTLNSYAAGVTTFTINYPSAVIRVLGVPISRRWYWSACEVYP